MSAHRSSSIDWRSLCRVVRDFPARTFQASGLAATTRRLNRSSYVVVFGIFLGFCSGAAAEMSQGTEQERQACTPDVFRLCGDFIPDPARITTCLRQKARNLSPACRMVITGPARRVVAHGSQGQRQD